MKRTKVLVLNGKKFHRRRCLKEERPSLSSCSVVRKEIAKLEVTDGSNS